MRGGWPPRILPLLLLVTGCLDVVEHGIPVGLTVITRDCANTSVIDGATELRLTAKSGEAILLSRTVPAGAIPRALGLPESTDVQLRVEALDSTGKVIARGTSLHFPVAVTPTTQVSVELYPVDRFTRVCSTLGTARAFHTATLLIDGRVLIIGGQGNAGEVLSSMELLSGAEVRDGGPLALSAAGSVFRLPRARHAATLANAGQLVVAGGDDGTAPLSSVLFIDPSVDFGIGALGPQPPHDARTRHAAYKRGSSIFFVGGSTIEAGQQVPNPTVERLDLATNQIRPVTTLPTPRLEAALAQLDSVAIVAGGVELSTASTLVDLVSLDSPSVSRLALTTARRSATAVAVGERVLIAGGFDRDGAPLASSEWLHPARRTVEPGPSISPRADSCAAPLTGGRALLMGGMNGSGPTAAAELIEGDGARSISFPGPARHAHACITLEDGSALVIGGLDANARPLNDLWRYTPAE